MSKPFALVLGGAGFIGRYVCRYFANQGYVVIALGHDSWQEAEHQNWGVSHWVSADITLASIREAMGSQIPAVIIHCGGGGSVSSAYQAPFDDYNRSVTSTAEMLEYVRTEVRSMTRVVLASSAAVYGDQGEVDLVESAPYAPVSPYGFSKLAAENLCQTYSRFFNVSCSVVRLFSVYGEGLRKQLLWDAMKKLSAHQATFFGNGLEKRDWIHVQDAASLIFLAATAGNQTSYEIYNGAYQQAVISDVLTTLFQKSGSELTPIFNGQTHTGNPSRLTASTVYSQNQLHWYPEVSLDEGLSRYVSWFKRVETVR